VRALAALPKKLDDWINPIAVKELRQAVQSKFVTGLLVLFLLGQFVTASVVVLSIDQYSYEFDAGRSVFTILFGILVGTCLLFLPAYSAVRLAGERSGAKTDLYFVTALRPRTIVWGKFLSGLVLAVLVHSAFMPFLTFTYLLRGIDLPTIFILLFIGFVAAATAILFATFLACIPATRFLKVVIGLVGFGFISSITYSIIAAAHVSLQFGVPVFSGDFLRVLVPMMVFGLIAMGCFFVWSVALLSPPSANRMLPVRAYMTIVWLVTGAAISIWGLGTATRSDFFDTWTVLSVLMFCVGLMTAVSERDVQGARITRRIPRRWWLRPFAFLMYTGAAGGIVWACLMIGLTLLVALLVSWVEYGRYYGLNYTAAVMGGLALYAFCYAMTASLIRRTFFPKARLGHTWVFALFLAGIAFLVPMLAPIVRGDLWEPQRNMDLWNLANPTMVFDNDFRTVGLTIAGIWAIGVFLLSLPWLARQIRAFRPYIRATDSEPQATNHE